MSQNTQQILNPVLSGYTAVYFTDDGPQIPRAIFMNGMDANEWAAASRHNTRRERVDIGAILRYDERKLKP